MKSHNRSLGRILLTCALIVAANASTAHSQFYDPLDIHNHHKPWGKYGPTVTYPSPTKVMNALNGRSNRQPNRRVARRDTQSPTARQAATSRATRFDELNLLVTMPTGPWVKLDPKETGSRASFIISRTDPTIIISLAGERAGIEAGDTNTSLLAQSQAKMQSLPGGAVEPGERQLSAGGIQGVAYEATVANDQFTTYYSIWVAAHNGYNYKLAVYGEQKNKPTIDEAMRNFTHGIKQIQSNRIARANGKSQR